MNPRSSRTWVLAFDASCCRCRAVADQVRRAGGGRLEVRSLADPEVDSWRRRALGVDAPASPTLIRVRDGDVRAWTGLRMALRLAARLRPRAVARLLAALGELRRDDAVTTPVEGGRRTIGRARFLRLAGAGVAVALLGGRLSLAHAADRKPTAAQEWVQANKGNLPQRYADLVTYDMRHRRAIIAELPAETRSRLWLEHLEEYSTNHPDLTADQRRVIGHAVELASQEGTFADQRTAEVHRQLEDLRQAAIAAFGLAEARALLATLGPAQVSPALDACGCSTESPWCANFCDACRPNCHGCSCTCTDSGCGTFWGYPCNGQCD